MTPWWTSALMDQAIARAVRMGQTKVVRVIHLVLAEVEEMGVDIDKMMMGTAEDKRELLEDFFALAVGKRKSKQKKEGGKEGGKKDKEVGKEVKAKGEEKKGGKKAEAALDEDPT